MILSYHVHVLDGNNWEICWRWRETEFALKINGLVDRSRTTPDRRLCGYAALQLGYHQLVIASKTIFSYMNSHKYSVFDSQRLDCSPYTSQVVAHLPANTSTAGVRIGASPLHLKSRNRKTKRIITTPKPPAAVSKMRQRLKRTSKTLPTK